MRIPRRYLRSLNILSLVLLITAASNALAQNNPQYAIQRAQGAIRDQIWRDHGGANNIDVSFPEWNQAETYRVSNTLTGVRGRGVFTRRNNYQDARAFSYEAVINVRNGRVDRAEYRVDGQGNTGGGSEVDYDVPSWLVGSYRGRNPGGNRQRLTLTINRNGRVRAVYDNGTRDRGNYDNGLIRFGGDLGWTITQSGNDIRARDIRTGRSEKFTRTSESIDNDDEDEVDSNVPRWMVGTFRGMAPSGEAELSIGPDGTASIRSISTNRLFNGRVDNRILTFEFGSYDVEREGRGIRTINRNDRNNRTSYTRVN
ncbi:MAG TPA: hypothetical protein VIB00_09720 [Pyrinomonadaceae bacterium]